MVRPPRETCHRNGSGANRYNRNDRHNQQQVWDKQADPRQGEGDKCGMGLQLYRRSVHFYEGDQHPSARTVRINNHLLIPDRVLQVIDLESNVRSGLHQVWIRRAVPVSLPLNAERVVLVIAYGDVQLRQWDLPIEPGGRWYADVVVLLILRPTENHDAAATHRRVRHRVRLVPGPFALFHFAAAVDLGSRPVPGASGRVVEIINWHGQCPCRASSRNVMVSASKKSGDRPRRIIMSSFGSSSDFWPLSLYRNSPSSLNSAGVNRPRPFKPTLGRIQRLATFSQGAG